MLAEAGVLRSHRHLFPRSAIGRTFQFTERCIGVDRLRITRAERRVRRPETGPGAPSD